MHARMPMSMASRTGPLPPTLDLKRAAFSGMRVLLYTGDWSVYQSQTKTVSKSGAAWPVRLALRRVGRVRSCLRTPRLCS